MKGRSLYMSGILALSIVAGVMMLSRVGFRETGERVVSAAVGFFTRQDVSPGGGRLVSPATAYASETPADKKDEPPEGMELAKAENKKALAEKGLAVVTGRVDPMLGSEEAPPPDESDQAAASVRDAEAKIADVLGRFMGAGREKSGLRTTGALPPVKCEADAVDRDRTVQAEPAVEIAARQTKPEPEPASKVEARPVAGAATAVEAVQAANALCSEYDYRSSGRRDPFRALVGGEGDEKQQTDKLNLDGARLVGILWGKMVMALLEDSQGISFCLEKGDRVEDGRLVEIRSDAVVFNLYRYGGTQTVTLDLEKRKKAGGL